MEVIRSFQPEYMTPSEYQALVLPGYQYPPPPVCSARWALQLPTRYDDVLSLKLKLESVRFYQ
ncbi:hypothetical protein [Streptomyces turgidiscabies]|uniref:Transposase n=1 Tax=Streptomyces turgidiscabies TaxID=85558 RepID=A0ABU0S1E5_9ACTN|nr:hypothetical protein [Streptomyces turgidiscabies]MDQ0938081.1 hypothetical protein [Streptomyces turgidiscabies]